ncbi:hypothetical protein CHU95_03430 [Niveispirillum lacus]|uniref:Uncharacterized protein n=1 Tax=Niveispirillum lacus TaxID=1981099 RepID=A0A255Z7E8_9PROT|nr:DUF6527 family protein [Niveispirillum lacus]OYQ36834.1 hypothetical protein CHU95_03430 [Niveispirillum lacus]
MMQVNKLRTVFTTEIPEILEDGVLYVSRECCVALHNCACGCGEEVSTPLVSTEYRLTMHDEGASIWPSIGNHDFACASHYIIDRGAIVWAGKMTRTAIEAGRQQDRLLKRPPLSIPTLEQRPKQFSRGIFSWIGSVLRRILGR